MWNCVWLLNEKCLSICAIILLWFNIIFQINGIGIERSPSYSLNSYQFQPCDKSRKVLTEPVGEISDGPVGINYTQDSHCEWLIKAQNDSQFITLRFHSMGTECSYDYVYVYDGDSFNSTLLGSFSGRTEPQILVAKSGSMLILLYSDTNYVLDGFRASYYISNCLNNCHNHGKCVGHQCVCLGEWVGPDCEDEACPEKCGEAMGRGKCIKGMCKCSENYSGRLCDLHKNPKTNSGNWRWLATDAEGMTPRAAHTSIYLEEQDSLYIFGGYDLNNVISSLQIYRFNTSRWEDEWGIPLQNRHNFYHPQKIDNTLLKAVLSNENAEEAKLWGLNSDVSFFKKVLYILAESNIHQKRVYSNGNMTQDNIADFLDDILENVTDNRPLGRYGHAAEKVPGGFVIHGGKLENGTFSNELWFYNATDSGGEWILRAVNSIFQPPALARHTLTMAADGFLYLFGGSLNTGEFSSKIYRIRLSNEYNDEQWEEVKPRGGKSLEVRLSAHSTVYYTYTNSLIVFGGIMTSLARFSKLSDRIFAFQLDKLHWSEILYPRTALHDSNFPHERAFHTATISGNYMIIYGGYTHRHNKDEICYDNQMYWYHLSCHIWVKREFPSDSLQYPKKQGVFAHSAAVRRNNTLLIVGGYHGNVNADLFAYEFPQILRVRDPGTYNPEEACQFHTSYSSCLSDPECGWCSADTVCYGRTIGANCTTNLQITRCPGICPSLGDCHSCLIHGTPWSSSSSRHFSVANKLGLNHCTWCVQNARCHHKDDNYATICGENMSQIPGWWGKKGTEISSPQQCTEYDRRPGLTYIKYHYPVNLTMPDYVSIINATMVDFEFPTPTTQVEHSFSGEMLARLLGFIRPPPNWDPPQFTVCSSYSNAVLRSSIENTIDSLKVVDNKTSQHLFCSSIVLPSTENRVLIDFQAKRKIGNATPYNSYQKSQMDLQYNSSGHLRAFTFEYLEPFYSGDCEKYKNCLHCLTDSSCGWCDLKSECFSRSVSEIVECSMGVDWRFLIIQPAQCANCSNFIGCKECIDSKICEWWAEDARCSRIGMSKTAIRESNKCPSPCRLRKSCSDCLDERGRCVWCEAKSQCFSFSVYTTEYQFGMCREWLDQAVPPITETKTVGYAGESTALSIPKQQQCKPCSHHQNCSSCLKTLGCGWCFDRDNPIEGICLQGDFSQPFGNCSAALNTSVEDAEWAYAQCPDVDECGLQLHHCHREAKCTNTQGGYNCHCRRGYIGDGWVSCIRTCNETCSHGHCSGTPEYKCICDLGWTGSDCSINCGCNYHSTCLSKVGKCDLCHDWTEGERCDRCRPGSYGNATSEEGCFPCECNGHGNQDLGICDPQTGECFCKDNTGGLKCEVCNREYFGDPRGGEQCYFQCESRGLLTEIGRKGIGSFQSYKNPWGGQEVRECLWLISPRPVVTDSLIQVSIEWQSLNVECDENAVYIYNSLPDLTGNAPQSQLIAVVCSPYSKTNVIEARSGHMTIHYKQSRESFGFNALYNIRNCGAGTCLTPHICDGNKKCVCPSGHVGSKCEIEICPNNCNKKLLQGYCDRDYGRCVCQPGFGGTNCSVLIKPYHLVIDDIFNTMMLSESYDHLRKTIPRFGHSLNADKRGSLWMFGGYSLTNGPLNDIRQFDTKNGTWMQVTVESTPEAFLPLGRYFHAADIHPAKQALYIYGGVTSLERAKPHLFLDDLWHFNIPNQRWEKIEFYTNNRPPPLAGHTLTFIKIGDTERMLLVGGTSASMFTQLVLWQFDLDTKWWQELTTVGVRMPALYGHSAVYHSSSQIVYVFGGYSDFVGNKLYALNLMQMTWSELPPFKELNRPDTFLPRSRYFHTAVTTEKYMVIYGGRTKPYNSSDTLNVYVYDCNQWIRLNEDVDIVGKLIEYTYAEGMTIDQDNNVVYIVGGWDGVSQSQVTRIHLPKDICQLWSDGKYHCRQYMGCSFCSASYRESSKAFCFSEGNTNVCEGLTSHIEYNNGVLCDSTWMSRRNCSNFKTCSSCLGSWPAHIENTPVCQWCTDDCGVKGGHCVWAGASCQTSWCTKHTSVGLVEMCPPPQCHTLQCESCLFAHRNCHWAVNDVGITECISKDLVEKNDYKIIDECPAKCNEFTNCTSCLSVELENPKNCKWSTLLNACISSKTQPLYCAGGVCGLVLDSNELEHCPEPCNVHTQCSTCLRHAYCGWCSLENGNGEGVCTEGSLESLAEYPARSTCDIIYASQKNITHVSPEETFSWNYVNCPAENECLNNHHSCNKESELCVDSNVGYKCICNEGFKDEKGKCVPVCSQGCVRGKCVKPNICQCHFGYVGENCSIQCQCNGHSDCSGPHSLDECLKCHNNTKGKQCDLCEPLFVGNPKENKPCVSCLTYCNGHTDVCLSLNSEHISLNMSKTFLENNLSEGPIDNATCIRCANNTAGPRCDTCITGYFRGSDDHTKECRPCQCHGHGEICDSVTGEKCNCGNNTESDATCTAGGGKNSAQLCWMVQCSKCRDLYAGNPTDGHQCYKQITVESRMCFDGKLIDDCKVKPSPLRPGQTVFFVIQPRFMNVDIRIVIDVTQGELDVFMSPQDDSFIVETNQSTGHHHIFLDNRYRWMPNPRFTIEPLYISQPKYNNNNNSLTTIKKIEPSKDEKNYWLPHIHDCKSLSGAGFNVKDYQARDLSTYITLNECNTLLRLFGLKNRLVLTLPQTAHNLSATRFFIAVRASVGSDHSYGSIVFRQDQLHIDLFVFFSVFFSCFFLFLAICVVAWKAKQTSDLRRARRRHVVEMLHMAKRPFSCIFVSVNPENDSPIQNRRRGRSKTSASTNALNVNEIRPVAIEPTSDNIAAVGTVFISLPGKYIAPVTLALGSSLITLPRQYPLTSRTFLRRPVNN